MPLKIVRNDITQMNTDAIVCTASAEPTGTLEEGDVFITPGYGLLAKYIIHAVSPLFIDGNQGEEELLRRCYRESLALASEYGIHSIAFPLISTGSFGYSKEEGMRIAVDEINAFLLTNHMDITLVVFDAQSTNLGQNLFHDLEAYIDENYVEAKAEYEYPQMAEAMPMPLSGNIRDIPNSSVSAGGKTAPKLRKSIFPKLSKKSVDIPYETSREAIESKEAIESIEQIETIEATKLTESIDTIASLENELSDRLSHLTDTFSEYLLYLIQSKGMENAEVYKRAIVDKKTFSKIKNNPQYHPQKMTALCLCVGAQLNLDETKDLLARAGYALSPCDMTDIIFSFFIEQGYYDMIEIDIQLEEHGLPCIIA